MPETLKGTDKAIRVLKELVTMWADIKAAVRAIRNVRGSGSAEVKVTPDGLVIHVSPILPPADTRLADGSYYFAVVSSSSVGTNQWNYKLRVMKSGDTSSLTGLIQTSSTTEYDGRNTWETLTKAGYVNSSVSSLLAIPNGAIVRAYPGVRNGVRVMIFSERNEPAC